MKANPFAHVPPDRKRTTFTWCPEHGWSGRKDPETGYWFCPRCGRELGPPPKR